MTTPLVEFAAVRKGYDGKTVLPGLDLAIREGEFLTLLGPSGCGKTTALRLLAGFETPDAGEIRLDGLCIDALPPERRPVNTVFQSYALFPHMNVADNVGFGLRMQGVPAAERRRRVAEAQALVRLEGLESRRPGQLSGGQQQRVALARALVNHPRVLLLDESLSALDYRLRKDMQGELKALQRRLGLTFLFVTHDQEEALSLSDRVAVMRAGVIQQIGTPRDIYENPANSFVAGFVGESNFLDARVLRRLSAACIEVLLEGHPLGLRCALPVAEGDTVRVLLRPEDLRVRAADTASTAEPLRGEILDTRYRGVTLDLVIRLDSGQTLTASAFFNDAIAGPDGTPGRRVAVGWTPGRETVLGA